MTFTNITNKIDRILKTNESSYPIADKVVDINLALDKVFTTIFKVGGTWQFDDSNHVDYPEITTDLNSGQRDYSFTTDEQGNLILDIYRVFVKGTSVFEEIYPIDVQSGEGTESLTDGLNAGGTPYRYDKTANGIFLDPIPDYNSTNGLKIMYSREGSYFTVTDTTKKPGFAGLFHEYLVLRPAYEYAYANSLPNMNALKLEMLTMEQDLTKHYAQRERDVVNTLGNRGINFR